MERKKRGEEMKPHRRVSPRAGTVVIPGLVMLLSAFSVLAQEQAPPSREVGNYSIQQSLEFGGRVASIRGNGSVYDTFVNLLKGPGFNGKLPM